MAAKININVSEAQKLVLITKERPFYTKNEKVFNVVLHNGLGDTATGLQLRYPAETEKYPRSL